MDAEKKFKPFLSAGASVKFHYLSGGQGALATVNGDQFDLTNRRALKSAFGAEFIGYGSMLLNPKLKVEARVRYQTQGATWDPRFGALVNNLSESASGVSTSRCTT